VFVVVLFVVEEGADAGEQIGWQTGDPFGVAFLAEHQCDDRAQIAPVRRGRDQ
jgi:hypothetical protein